MKKILLFIPLIILAFSCNEKPKDIGPNKVIDLFGENILVGTDSAIYIVDERKGIILSRIPRY